MRMRLTKNASTGAVFGRFIAWKVRQRLSFARCIYARPPLPRAGEGWGEGKSNSALSHA